MAPDESRATPALPGDSSSRPADRAPGGPHSGRPTRPAGGGIPIESLPAISGDAFPTARCLQAVIPGGSSPSWRTEPFDTLRDRAVAIGPRGPGGKGGMVMFDGPPGATT